MEGPIMKARRNFHDASERWAPISFLWQFCTEWSCGIFKLCGLFHCRHFFLTTDVLLIAQVIFFHCNAISVLQVVPCSHMVQIVILSHIQATNKSRKTFRLKERVMLIHSWIADTIFEDQQIPPCGGYS